MAVRYQVLIKNQAGSVVALMTDWRRLEYELRVNDVHSHVYTIDGALAVAQELAAESGVDYQVEVYRSDLSPQYGAPIPLYLDYEGFHRTVVDQTLRDGAQLLTSYGRGYLDLVARAEVGYPAGASSLATKTGPGETVIKEYVDENVGPGATDPPRTLAGANVMPGVSIEVDNGDGGSWTGSRPWRNLLDVIKEIGDATDVDFEMVGTGAATFEFQCRAYPLGTDRSTQGLDRSTGLNAAGNAPVIFSLSFGNMGSPVFSRARTQEATAIIVLGQGLDAARAVEVVEDATAAALSPWNRIEVSRNANQESTTAGLTSVGEALLEELKAQEKFTFELMESGSTRYGRDFFYGDIVTARYKDIERHYQIMKVKVVVEAGRETIQVEVKDVIP